MGTKTRTKIWSVVLVFLLWLGCTAAAGRTIYVDDDAAGANDGSSWADAYNHLQDGLAIGSSGEEIWVAQGTYKPDQGDEVAPGDREATFQLKNGVTIKGGFAGFGEPDPNARDVNKYETILSGDLSGDDVDVGNPADLQYEPTRAENSYHVVVGSGTDATAVLDGFTITGGYTGAHLGSGGCGGGILIDDRYGESSPTLNNCTFTGNWGHDGGGMLIYHCSPKLTNCTFSQNAAKDGGGGIHISDGLCNLTLVNCTFIQNFAGRQGGAMFNEGTDLIAVNCTFIGNSARYGGAMYNVPIINGRFTNCIFIGNAATDSGGAMRSVLSNFSLINCTFSGNSAPNGSALACNWPLPGYPSNIEVTNCVLWDGGNEVVNTDNSEIEITYSDVQGGWSGDGNIDADPCFIEPGYWDADGLWVDGNYHLRPDSPCIDAGDNTAVPPSVVTDLDGNPRVICGRIDMGAYEFQREPRDLYVDDDAPGDPGPGDPTVSDPLEDGTQAHPFDAIQKAIDAALCGDTVIVIDGTYFENINFKGKNIILRSTHPNNPDIVAATIIDGSQAGSVVSFSGIEDETCVLSGFTIRNGYQDYLLPNYTKGGGGGICGGTEDNHSQATIQNNIITGNHAWDGGGLSRCDGLIEKNTIIGNTARWYQGGGGLYECNGIIRNNLIIANRSGGCESGSGLSHCNGTIENNTITSNFTQGFETVAHCRGTIRNCIIWGNSPVQTWWLSTPSFSCIQGWGGGGDGNIDADPCFIHPGYWEDPCNTPYAPWDDMWIDGDYHLKSEGWRWDTKFNPPRWGYDYATSRCIDAGNPGSVLGEELLSVPDDPNNTWGQNLRINMGAYGGTAEASMPPYDWAILADLTNDGTVNFEDFAGQTRDLQESESEQPGDLDRNGVIDFGDLALLVEDWLEQTSWYEP